MILLKTTPLITSNPSRCQKWTHQISPSPKRGSSPAFLVILRHTSTFGCLHQLRTQSFQCAPYSIVPASMLMPFAGRLSNSWFWWLKNWLQKLGHPRLCPRPPVFESEWSRPHLGTPVGDPDKNGVLLRHRLLENKEQVTCSNGIVKCVGPSKLQGRDCAFLAVCVDGLFQIVPIHRSFHDHRNSKLLKSKMWASGLEWLLKSCSLQVIRKHTQNINPWVAKLTNCW